MKKEQSTTSLNSDLSLHLLQPPIGPAKGVVRCAVLGAPMVGKSNLVQAILDKVTSYFIRFKAISHTVQICSQIMS